MTDHTKNLSPAELQAILQKQYRRFISRVRIERHADGRAYVRVEFADSGENDANARMVDCGG